MKTAGEPEEIHVPREDGLPLVLPVEEPAAVPAEAPPPEEKDPVPA